MRPEVRAGPMERSFSAAKADDGGDPAGAFSWARRGGRTRSASRQVHRRMMRQPFRGRGRRNDLAEMIRCWQDENKIPLTLTEVLDVDCPDGESANGGCPP